MRAKGPAPVLRPSLLRADEKPVGRTQSEIEAIRNNINAAIAYEKALDKSEGKFEDCPTAITASRLGRPPRSGTLPATNASALYFADKRRR